MKKIFTLFLLAFLVGCSSENLDVSPMIPQVKEVELKIYDFSYDGITHVNTERYKHVIEKYNVDGNIEEKVTYDIHRNLHHVTSYQYSEGFLIEENNHNVLIDENESIFYYYEEDRIVRKDTFIDEIIDEYQIIEYADKDEFTTTYAPSGNIRREESIQYSQDMTKKYQGVWFDSKGNKYLDVLVVYDESDFMIRQIVKNEEKTTISNRVNDENGNEIETKIFENDILMIHFLLEYDEHNNSIKVTDAIKDEFSITKYNYDDYGNVIRKEVYIDDVLIALEETKIVYLEEKNSTK